MADWSPIERGKFEVHGVDNDAPGLLRASAKLSREPPSQWVEFFERPIGVGLSLSMHTPTIYGSTISIRPPDAELEKYVAHVDERIASANARYESDVLPKQKAAEERQRIEFEEQQRRIEDARRRAEEL